jgi:hypothetical protein
LDPVCKGSPGDHCIKTEELDTRRQVGRERRLRYFQSEYHVKTQNVNIFLFLKIFKFTDRE